MITSCPKRSNSYLKCIIAMIECIWNWYWVVCRLDDDLRFCRNSCGKQTYIEKEVIWDQVVFLTHPKISLNPRVTFWDFQLDETSAYHITIAEVIDWSERDGWWSPICHVMRTIDSKDYSELLDFIFEGYR